MEEKKLTDEEYIERLEYCQHPMSCCICKYENNCFLDNKKTVNLIRRLQGEIERLTEELAEEKKLYFDMQDVAVSRYMENCQLIKQRNELQQQVEKLTEELATAKQELVNEQRYYENAYSKACQLETQNAELQKQVDELKVENTELHKEHTILIAGSILQKQDIAKDTAKEILTKIRNNDGYLNQANWIDLCNRFGVEVE